MAITGKHGAATAVILAAALTGCTSVKSTYLHRNDDDSRWATNHIKGIPITLDVPTHVRFSVLETIYTVTEPVKVKTVDPTTKKETLTDTGDTKMELVMLDAGQPLKTYNVTYDFITEKKIFGVDFKRPAAGPFSLTANFNGQYFKDIDHRLTDQTIQKVGEAINTLVGQLVPTGIPLKAKAQSSDGGPVSAPVPLESLVCSEVFRLDAPDFELQVAAFLREHCCSPLAPRPLIENSNTLVPVPLVPMQGQDIPMSNKPPVSAGSNVVRAGAFVPAGQPPTALRPVTTSRPPVGF